jgi:hypothetical protein
MTGETTPVPVSGRRRANVAPVAYRPAGFRPARAAALAVAVVGALLVLAGGLRATVYAPSPTVAATLSGARTPVVTTAVGLLALDGPRAEIVARDASRRPVFVGIGRAADVDAYLAGVSRVEVTGHDGNGALLTTARGKDRALPDPASADVWVVSQRATGEAAVAWPDTPGQWRVVVATDGTGKAPDSIGVTWSGRDVSTGAPALVAVGLVLVVGGLITVVMLASRARLPRPDPTHPGSRDVTDSARSADTLGRVEQYGRPDRHAHDDRPGRVGRTDPAPPTRPIATRPAPTAQPAPTNRPAQPAPTTRPAPTTQPARNRPAADRPGRLDELARPHGFDVSDPAERADRPQAPRWPGDGT